MLRTLKIITAAENANLVTRAAVKIELSIGDDQDKYDAWINSAIAQMSAEAVEYCRRTFPVETVQETILRDGWCSGWRDRRPEVLSLQRWPLVGITSVVANGTAFTADTDFTKDDANGFLIRLSSSGNTMSWWGSLWPLVITYQAGYAAIPADLQGAMLRAMTMRFKGRNRDPMLMSTGGPDPGDNQRFWVGALPNQKGPFPPEIAMVLDRYRAPRFG